MALSARRVGRVEQWSPASPWAMRDAAYDLLTQLPDFKKVLKVTPSQVQPEDCPCLVMDLNDSATNPQPNQQTLKFIHYSTLTLAIMCADDSNLLAEGTIWTLAETVLIQLLRNQDFPREYLEGIERMSMSLRIPSEGETFLASLNIILQFTTQSAWEPIIPHKLRELMIERRLTPEQTETGLDWDIIYPDWNEEDV